MSFLLIGFHPTFESLSAHADECDVNAARTRIARHVARCAQCAGTVAEIRAMGEAARAAELPGAPAELWARIEGAQADDAPTSRARETPAPDSDVPWQAAPALRPTTHVPSPARRGLRRGAIALAAAAVITAVLLVPLGRGERLEAAAQRDTWRFSPAVPAPGSTVTVRFVPRAGFPAEPALLLLGTALDATTAPGSFWRSVGGLQDSLATLVRQRDGSYTGRFVVPDSFPATLLRLTDLANSGASGPYPRANFPHAVLIAGGEGRPSLAGLSVAGAFRGGSDDDAYSIGDTLVKYYPSEPLGYALLGQPRGSGRLIDNLIAWYRSGERQYLRFDERLMREEHVSADREVAMVIFANRIEEPAEVRKWTLRLAREHGDDPRAMYLYGPMLHGMLLRAGTADSVRRDLALADSLWERNGHRAASASIAITALQVHDTARARRWDLRAMQSGELDWRANRYLASPATLADQVMRDASREALLAESARSCVMPPGRRALWNGFESWEARCQSGRASAFGMRSLIARLDGEPRLALTLADSAVALMARAGNCQMHGPRAHRGQALLALGDTSGAVADLAAGVTDPGWRTRPYRDSLAFILRPAVDSARWAAATAKADAEQAACWRRLSAGRRAAADSAKARLGATRVPGSVRR